MSFEPGARASEDFIPLCVPEVQGNEWNYIKECLDTGWVSSVGSYVDKFEQMIAARASCQYAVATVNGTAAIHTALLVTGVQPNDEVLTSALTFIAPINAIRYAHAWPVFIDASPTTAQMDIQKLHDFLHNECVQGNGALINKKTGRIVRAILPVHILGHTVDMDPLLKLARKFELFVIEDATECLGANYKGRAVGSLGDGGCFSFNGNKIITTGGGGAYVTNNKDRAKQTKYLTTQAKDDPVEYIHNQIGYNYRLTNIQAAMGCAQMEKLDSYIAAKQKIANVYNEQLQGIPGIRVIGPGDWCSSIWWMYTIRIDEKAYGIGSRELLHRLQLLKIQTRPLWQPMHLSPAHSVCQAYHCETAEALYHHSLSLPCSVSLIEDQQRRVIHAIQRRCEM